MKKIMSIVLAGLGLVILPASRAADEPKLTLAQAQEIVAGRLKQDGLADKKHEVRFFPGSDKAAPFYYVEFATRIPDPKAKPDEQQFLSYAVDMAGKIRPMSMWIESHPVPANTEPIIFQPPTLDEFWTKPLRFETNSRNPAIE